MDSRIPSNDDVSPITSPLASPRVEQGLTLVLGASLVLGAAGMLFPPLGWMRQGAEVTFILSLSSLIGYGTNWIAVQMLFWPPRRGGWWILGWRGLIYDQKEALAEWIPRAMEERNLISSRAIMFHLFGDRARSKQTLETLFRVLETVVDDPEFVDRVVRELTRAIERVSPSLIEEVLKSGDQWLEEFLNERMDTEAAVETVVDRLREWGEDGDVRQRLTDCLATVVRALSPEIARAIHLTQRDRNPWYRMASNFGVMNSDLVEAELTKLLKREVFWTRISHVIQRYLADDTRRNEIRNQLTGLVQDLKPHLLAWFRERGADRLNELLTEEIHRRDLFKTVLHTLREHREGVLDFLGETFTRPPVQHLFRRITELLIDEFQLKALIRQQILQQDPADFKRMIEHATKRHLRVIKVLGAAVGALCGIFLLPGSLRWAGLVLVLPGVAVGAEFWRQRRLREKERPKRVYRWSARLLLAVVRSVVTTPGPEQMKRIKQRLRTLFPDINDRTIMFREERRQFADGVWEAERLGEALDRSRRRALWEAVVEVAAPHVDQPVRVPFLEEVRDGLNPPEETQPTPDREGIPYHPDGNGQGKTPGEEPVGTRTSGPRTD